MDTSIYVVVCQSGTTISKIIKFFTRKPYNHVSLASSLLVPEMYSFCRTYKKFPIPATFNTEMVGKGTLGMYSDIPCEIYKIPVSYNQKEEFESLISHFKVNRKRYSYNYFGLCCMLLHIQYRNEKKFLCSQFAAHILQSIGINLKKPLALYTPEDFRHLPFAELIYRGELNSYYKEYNNEKISLPSISFKFPKGA